MSTRVSAQPLPPITQVSGGVGGLTATYQQVRSLADSYDRTGDRMRSWADTGRRVLADHDLVESAVLSPGTFAEAETAVFGATNGPHGIALESVATEADAVLIRATVAAFVECDRMVHASFEVLDYLLGRGLGVVLVGSVPVVLAAAVLAGPDLYVVWPLLPAKLQHHIEQQGAHAVDDLQQFLDDHPDVVQHLANGGGGLLDGLLGSAGGAPFGIGPFTPTTNDAAATLAALYGPEGPPHVGVRDDLSVPSGQVAPGSLQDVLAHLAETNALAGPGHSENDGAVEIQAVHTAAGGVRYIVYLPGTDDLTTLPWTQDDDVRDLGTNLDLIAGHATTYEHGIVAAMHQAGIGPDDPVLLAGHSQGGMEAAAILSHGSGFHVTHVVTAGAPTGQVHQFPPGTHVLSLENDGDVVPLLDGEDNPDSVQQTTIRFHDTETSIAGNHDLGHYVRGAAAADASRDLSVAEQIASLRDDGFLGAPGTATSQVFQITR